MRAVVEPDYPKLTQEGIAQHIPIILGSSGIQHVSHGIRGRIGRIQRMIRADGDPPELLHAIIPRILSHID